MSAGRALCKCCGRPLRRDALRPYCSKRAACRRQAYADDPERRAEVLRRNREWHRKKYADPAWAAARLAKKRAALALRRGRG